jgi:large subunit ribosomal protein L15
MKLHEISPAAGARGKRKRLGRGVASGQGKTAGRGSKGQGARSGGNVRPGFEGGQMPIHRRLPKRGFTNLFKRQFAIVNLRDLARFESGSTVDEVALVKQGLVRGRYDGIKLLAQGEVTQALQVKVHAVSKRAAEKIAAAGGTVEVL